MPVKLDCSDRILVTYWEVLYYDWFALICIQNIAQISNKVVVWSPQWSLLSRNAVDFRFLAILSSRYEVQSL